MDDVLTALSVFFGVICHVAPCTAAACTYFTLLWLAVHYQGLTSSFGWRSSGTVFSGFAWPFCCTKVKPEQGKHACFLPWNAVMEAGSTLSADHNAQPKQDGSARPWSKDDTGESLHRMKQRIRRKADEPYLVHRPLCRVKVCPLMTLQTTQADQGVPCLSSATLQAPSLKEHAPLGLTSGKTRHLAWCPQVTALQCQKSSLSCITAQAAGLLYREAIFSSAVQNAVCQRRALKLPWSKLSLPSHTLDSSA